MANYTKPYTFLMTAIDPSGNTEYFNVANKAKYQRQSFFKTESAAKRHLGYAVEVAEERGYTDIHWIIYCNNQVVEQK